MRPLELIFTTILLLSIIQTFFPGKKYTKLMPVLPGSAVLIAIICMALEGFRLIMGPLYVLSMLLFIIVLMKKRRTIKAFGIIVFCMAFLSSIMLSWFLPVISLPEPSGPNKVGTIILDFTNPSRTNVLTKKKEVQKIGVQV